MPAGPPPAAHQLHAFEQPAGGREDQRPGEIGRRLGENAGRVGDEHFADLGRDEIDVVVADRAIRDDAKVREILELCPAHPSGQQGHDRDPVTPGRGLVGGKPSDVEVCELRRLEEVLELGRDENSVNQSTFSPLGPTYSDCGRMRWSSACCSITWAHQPATRPQANVATKERGSSPSAWSTSAVKNSTLVRRLRPGFASSSTFRLVCSTARARSNSCRFSSAAELIASATLLSTSALGSRTL